MQYQNKRVASLVRAVIQGLYALLGIAVVLAFFGDNLTLLNSIRFPLLALFIFVLVFSNLGALCELSISADDRYVEVSSTPILAKKGHVHTYSIEAEKLMSYTYIPVIFFHYLTIHYIGHRGTEKKVHVGMSLMSPSRRKVFFKIVDGILAKNKEREKV